MKYDKLEWKPAAQKTDPNTDLNSKLDQILENQKRIMEMFGEIGRILTEYAKNTTGAKEAKQINFHRSGTATEGFDLQKFKAKLAELEEQYGATCTQTMAAKIIGISPRTVARMLEAKKLRYSNGRVDMESIAEVICERGK